MPNGNTKDASDFWLALHNWQVHYTRLHHYSAQLSMRHNPLRYTYMTNAAKLLQTTIYYILYTQDIYEHGKNMQVGKWIILLDRLINIAEHPVASEVSYPSAVPENYHQPIGGIGLFQQPINEYVRVINAIMWPFAKSSMRTKNNQFCRYGCRLSMCKK